MKLKYWLTLIFATAAVLFCVTFIMSKNHNPKMSNIEFIPIGKTDRATIEKFAKEVAGIYGVSYHIAVEPLELPQDAYDEERGQYLASVILEKLNARPETANSQVIGVASVDLYEQDMNWIFGLAEMPGHVSVISITRLRPEYWKRGKNEALFIKRAVKESVHEIGHTLGLEHCTNDRCVMQFSNSLGYTDYKSENFCKNCSAKLP